MSLFQLSWRNLQQNFRLYTIYFVSMVMGAIVQFTFSALVYHQDILDSLKNRDNFQLGVTIASAVIFLFILFFILYANSFFMRQRKKEFGMYLLFGLTEWQITFMVFYETLLLATIALGSGILLGAFLSKLFGMLLMNLMQYEQVISFTFPLPAVGITILLFFIIIIIISLHSYLNIKRVQLIELFHARSKAEKPIKSSSSLAFTAVILLLTSIFLISRGRGSIIWEDYSSWSLIIVTFGSIGGSYLFFRQFSGWMLQKIRELKHYHQGNTMLWTSALRFLVRSNALNLTFISLFSTVLIFLVGFVSINYAVQLRAVSNNLPNDIAFQSVDSQTTQEIDQLIKDSKHNIQYHQTLQGLLVKPITKMDIAFGNPEYYTKGVILFSENTYNKLVALRGDDEQVHLTGHEAVSLSQGTTGKTFTSKASFTVLANKQTSFQLIEKKDYAFLGWMTDPVTSMVIKPAVLIISNEQYQSLHQNSTAYTVKTYQISDAGNAEELTKKIHAIMSKQSNAYYSAYADVYSKQIESSSLLLFSGASLAVIALFALASVIYFKQLREATDEQKQYTILRKIGVSSSEMKSVIRKQLLFVFFPPMLLGMMHSWLVLKYYILDSVRGFPYLTNIIIGVLSLYFIIYLLLYFSSTKIYYKIANQQID